MGQPALPQDIAIADANNTALAGLEAVARGLIAEQDATLDWVCEMLREGKRRMGKVENR